jgi:hypothetical protein
MSEAFDYHTVEDPEALADLVEVLVELPEEDDVLFAGTEPQELVEAERVILGRLGLQAPLRAGSAWIAGSVPTV